ncbi:unnamed protein product [Rangifer tarandus platyrhynchus]|uniref:Uncharacterized protein n=2 Tax=Rangifer tarandus platyrhynchus TaxID=3082113 RepID=A0ACB0EZ95_RANTA|nr:unnamed protein product [Rangifer tarandus platyrhynchus]CAI9706001.1 unnamed protein product [Rangifer tarandus platyrhynchus]
MNLHPGSPLRPWKSHQQFWINRLKEKTGNTGLHDCRPCSRPCGRERAGLGGGMGRGSPAQSCSHRLLLRDFHKLHLQVDTSRCCSGDLRAQRAQRGENAAQRPTSHAFPTLDPAGGILGAPRSAGGGQAAPESQAPRTVLRAGHLNPAQRNGARDAQRRARGHTASQRPARPLIQFRFCQCLSLLCTDVSSA